MAQSNTELSKRFRSLLAEQGKNYGFSKNYSRNAVSSFANNKSNPKLSTVIELFEELGCELRVIEV